MTADFAPREARAAALRTHSTLRRPGRDPVSLGRPAWPLRRCRFARIGVVPAQARRRSGPDSRRAGHRPLDARARAFHAAGPRADGAARRGRSGAIPARSSRASSSAIAPAPSPAPSGPAPDGWHAPRAARWCSITSRSCRSPRSRSCCAFSPSAATRRSAARGRGPTSASSRSARDDLPARVARGALPARPLLPSRGADLPPAAAARARGRARRRSSTALLADLGERFGRPGLELAPRARAWMTHYSWPGNLAPAPERPRARPAARRRPRPRPAATGGERRGRAAVDRAKPSAGRSSPRSTPAAATRGRRRALLGISRKGLWEKRKRHGIP